MHPPSKRRKALRLRVKDRLSLRAISKLVAISKGTASQWLKEDPLTEEEVKERMSANGRSSSGRPPSVVLAQSSLHKQFKDRKFTRLQKAKIAEAAVLFRLLLHQYTVYGSSFDGDKADWIVDGNGLGRPIRIQVKLVDRSGHHGSPRVGLRCSYQRPGQHRSYREGEFDLIVGYDLFSDTAFVWSWDEVKHRTSSVTVCTDAKERWDKIVVGWGQPTANMGP